MTTLYELSVASYIQVVEAVDNYLDKGLAHCGVADIDLHELIEVRFCEDMWPLREQLVSVMHHSVGAVEGIRKGSFSPPPPAGDLDYASLQMQISEALASLQAIDPEDINAMAGKLINFKYAEHVIPFSVENFVLSFSLPNLHFHATTAYDMLRAKGVPLGKRDYLGSLRIKRD